jgi:endonuclease-3 related protein
VTTRQRLLRIFDLLLSHFGQRHWWPGETALEIAVGAILTQNTSWKNVEKAIVNLKSREMLDVRALYNIDAGALGDTIRSAGFFNIKAKRLKNFIAFVEEGFGGKVENLSEVETGALRRKLLGVNGIGYETADSIILYALNKPIFVVDAYTRRFLTNHGLFTGNGDYNEIQRYFTTNLPLDSYLFNEFHALLVCLGQRNCRKTPACDRCVLEKV